MLLPVFLDLLNQQRGGEGIYLEGPFKVKIRVAVIVCKLGTSLIRATGHHTMGRFFERKFLLVDLSWSI
jgi:hypothetical protein